MFNNFTAIHDKLNYFDLDFSIWRFEGKLTVFLYYYTRYFNTKSYRESLCSIFIPICHVVVTGMVLLVVVVVVTRPLCGGDSSNTVGEV